MAQLTPYERAVLRDARDAFDNPLRTPLSTFAYVVDRRARAALPIDEQTAMTVAAASGGLMALGELSARTLRPQAVLARFRHDGYRGIRRAADIATLDLWEVDEVAERLRPKYLIVGATIGALSAAAGVTTMAASMPVLMTTALRLVQEYALHYGFDIDAPEERAFALQVLLASTAPGTAPEDASFDHLARIVAALRRTWARQRRRAWGLPFALKIVTGLLRRDSGARLLRRAVALASAAFDAWMLLGVAETAQAAYRRRFLARRVSLAGKRSTPVAEGATSDPGDTSIAREPVE